MYVHGFFVAVALMTLAGYVQWPTEWVPAADTMSRMFLGYWVTYWVVQFTFAFKSVYKKP